MESLNITTEFGWYHFEAKQDILLALHASCVGGHSGFTATYNKVNSLFACLT
jgi:hypothetical protein